MVSNAAAGQPTNLIKSSREFVASYIAPSYLIDGILQHSRLYSLTGQTGAGKTAVQLTMAAHLAEGLPLGDHEVEECRVLYFSGENPDDVKGRWLAMGDHMGFNPENIAVHFIEGVFKISALRPAIEKEAQEIGAFGLVVIDTSAAYFEGEDENSNVQLGAHARMLRELTGLPGRPCVLVSCHPVKNAGDHNLLPRGGGAFLAEVDGNLTCVNTNMVAEVHWQGKFRGPEFESLRFGLVQITSDQLRDAKGRQIPTIMAQPLTEKAHDRVVAEARGDEDKLLIAMFDDAEASLSTLAEKCGWWTTNKESNRNPYKVKVQRMVHDFRRDGLITNSRSPWELTQAGEKRAKHARAKLQTAV